METLGTWNTKNGTITVTFNSSYGLAVWHNGRISGAHMSTERAQELVNALAGEEVWTA
jgi:hypothetical protein